MTRKNKKWDGIRKAVTHGATRRGGTFRCRLSRRKTFSALHVRRKNEPIGLGTSVTSGPSPGPSDGRLRGGNKANPPPRKKTTKGRRNKATDDSDDSGRLREGAVITRCAGSLPVRCGANNCKLRAALGAGDTSDP